MSGNVYSPVPTNYPQPDSARNLKQAETKNFDENWVIPPRRPMLVANDEHIRSMSSWLSRLDGFPCAASVKEMYHGICIVVSIFWDMPPRHFVHFLFVSISYGLVVLTGALWIRPSFARPLLLWLRELCDELFDPELAQKSGGSEKATMTNGAAACQNQQRIHGGSVVKP
eukprot:Skav215207  [mRNA]  locus=scaffold130:10158:13053:- [translate_table: standard]